MPELPEVETIRKGISPLLVGNIIKNVEIFSYRLRTDIPDNFSASVSGVRIKNVCRRAKYLLIELESTHVILLHLGMTGNLTGHNVRPTISKHDHVLFALQNGEFLRFSDPRRFGMIDLIPTITRYTDPRLKQLGPEPLENAFDANYLATALKNKKQAIKPALMDQRMVVGVGNIYAAESLFLSGIDPAKPAKTLHAQHLEVLVNAIKTTLQAALDSGGSTLRDYTNAEGKTGYFQHHFNVYGRKDAPCFRCNTTIQKITQAGRSTFFCPQCQT